MAWLPSERLENVEAIIVLSVILGRGGAWHMRMATSCKRSPATVWTELEADELKRIGFSSTQKEGAPPPHLRGIARGVAKARLWCHRGKLLPSSSEARSPAAIPPACRRTNRRNLDP